ncbi:MAG: hypothetical protein ACKVZ0_04535 [Gemmatimonadales bacterium]
MVRQTAVTKGLEAGRDRFLKRTVRFRFLDSIKVDKGLGQAAAFAKVLRKLGVTREDIAMVQASSAKYTREVGRQFLASLARRNLTGIPLLSSCAHLADSVDYSGKGRAVQLASVGRHDFALGSEPTPAPVPTSQFVPPDSFYRNCHVHGEGYGDGVSWPWSSETGFGGQWCDIEYQFSFVPSLTTAYRLSASVIAAGPYYVIANDGACDSKEASCYLQCSLSVTQDLPGPIQVTPTITANKVAANSPVVELFRAEGQNILEGDTCLGATRLELHPTLLFANIEANVSVTVSASAYARGEGSLADLNLAQPTGVIACLGLTVQ